MRVLVAPDSFSGTLSAAEAARAVADGWARQAPDDELDLAPMSDGGEGFVDVMQASLGGELRMVTVSSPFGEQVPATVLLTGGTAYLEAAQACGMQLTGGGGAELASSFGVGELLLAAVATGARRVVVGVGGSGAPDGGSGLLAALGAAADAPMDRGAACLAGITEVDLEPARARVRDVELVCATDVDIGLTGLFGTARALGDRLALDSQRQQSVDQLLERLAAAAGRRTSLLPGAGAGGGLGFGLLLLGARRRPGVELVAETIRLADRAAGADLVLTGEGCFDFASRSGTVPAGVAAVAERALLPCVVLAGRVLVGSREMRALGVESAYAAVDLVGEARTLHRPAEALADLAARVARTWSR